MHLNLRSSFVRASALAFFMASAALPAAAQTPRAVAANAVVDLSTLRIDNFGKVDPSYYRGALPMGDDYDQLATLGIKTVIDLTSDDGDAAEKGLTEGARMRYVRIPMTTHASPTTEQLAEFLNIVNDPASQPVYVHCVGGRHRTGVMTAVYRMAHDGWSSDQAFSEMKHYKFGADFLHAEFKDFVYGYRAAPAAAAAVSASGVKTR